MAYRQTGKAVIKDLIKRHQDRAADLQNLLNLLPDELSKNQDDALWNIACSIPRP